MTKHKWLKKAGVLALLTVFATVVLWIYTEDELDSHYFITEKDGLEIKTLCPTTKVRYGDEENYSVRVSLMGLIPVKTVDVTVLKDTRLIPGGQVFGIKCYCDGLIVVSISEINGNYPAETAGLKPGDRLTSADGKKLKTNEQLQEIVNQKGKDSLQLTFQRNGKEMKTVITPLYDKEDNRYKLGLWLCDSSAGIGTLTYASPTNESFGALGHGVSQADTGIVFPLRKGTLVEAQIVGITKGSCGAPGQLNGVFTASSPLANIERNCSRGIFGSIDKKAVRNVIPLPVGLKETVHEGKAKIRCTVDSSGIKEFDIEIIKINGDKTQNTRNMIIKVTDPLLLEKTGGIVQGMSGSPIIQDGKLIGAVTHVLVNDPTEGYGIFIENMIAASRETKDCVSDEFEIAA